MSDVCYLVGDNRRSEEELRNGSVAEYDQKHTGGKHVAKGIMSRYNMSPNQGVPATECDKKERVRLQLRQKSVDEYIGKG